MANRDEVLDVAKRMTELLKDEDFTARFNASIEDKGMMFHNQLFDALEEMQKEEMNGWNLSCNGDKMLHHLKMAVKQYPEEAIRMQMMLLVQTEEKFLDQIQRQLADKHGVEVPPEQGGMPHGHSHSHDGAHGHSHSQGGAHGHSHGGSHGHTHSHNGQPCHGHSHGGHNHGNMNPQQAAAMQMAMASLSDAQRRDLQAMQMKMMSGQPPSGADQAKMIQIQQHIAAYMQTMQAAVAGAAKNAPAAKK